MLKLIKNNLVFILFGIGVGCLFLNWQISIGFLIGLTAEYVLVESE